MQSALFQSLLLTVAAKTRSFLEPFWKEWHEEQGILPPVLSRHTCGRSSAFLRKVLCSDFGIDAEWKSGTARPGPQGGEKAPFGFFTGRRWENHAWVEAGPWTIDITADQFEEPAVLVLPKASGRYRETKDTALPEYQARRAKLVDELWPRWLAASERTDLHTAILMDRSCPPQAGETNPV